MPFEGNLMKLDFREDDRSTPHDLLGRYGITKPPSVSLSSRHRFTPRTAECDSGTTSLRPGFIRAAEIVQIVTKSKA